MSEPYLTQSRCNVTIGCERPYGHKGACRPASKGMKVYGWLGFRSHAATRHGHGQTREICAAKSKAEVGRLLGRDPRGIFNLDMTGNSAELAAALARPGVVLWRPLDDRSGDWREAGCV